MTNEKIVAKGKQIEAIDIELADVNEQIKILQAQANMLTSDKKQLTNEIVQLKQADNKTTNEQLVNEWASEMKSKYDNKITVEHDDFIQRSYITVSLTVSSWRKVSPQFAVTNNMSESQVKDYLHGIENTIKLFNEMTVQNMFENSNLNYGYIDEHSLRTIILLNNDSNKFISLHLSDNGLVEVKIEDHVYHMPRYEAQLYGELTLVPVIREDEYGNDIDEYPFKLYSESLIDIDMLGSSLKLMLSNFDKSKAQFINPIK